MSMGNWWSNNDRGELDYSEKNWSQCPFVHQISHTEWPVTEPGPPSERPATNHLNHFTALVFIFREIIWMGGTENKNAFPHLISGILNVY
jgi:hypothetical protein